MRITVGVTDSAWATYLRERPLIDEANFWVPSARSFMGRASLGEPFLFKTKAPHNRLVGGGFYEGFFERRVSEAWAVFGEGNGCASEDELEDAIQRYREKNKAPRMPDPTIGCLILRNVFFADLGRDLPQPERWGRSIVQGKTYDVLDPDWAYVDYAFNDFRGAARLDQVWDRDILALGEGRERYGAPVLSRARLGQGGFRLHVLEAYNNRCAITGSRLSPALEAAHIRAYASGGEHRVTNGLALRSDIHRLFDRGYLGVDTDYRLRVSPWVRRDSGNGVELYEREERGDLIRLPQRLDAYPDPEALAWHQEHVFRAA